MVCIPLWYMLYQEVTKWNDETHWVYGLYISGICYPRGFKVKWWNTLSLWFVYLRYMLPKRLQSEMMKHTEFMVCIPQVYATQEVTKWNDETHWVYGLYTSGICYPRGYKVKWWNTLSLWFVYLRSMLPKRLQSEMMKHTEFMVCIPQVYATQEVTKWNGPDTVSLWFVYLRYMLPKRLQSEMTTVSLWFVYPRYMLPKRLQSEMMTQWGFVYLSDPVYWFCELMLWFHNSLVNLDLRLFNFITSHALQFDCYCCCHYYC